MCGIAGYVSVTPISDTDSIIKRMAGAIAHRGPDDAGFYSDARARIGHRRLSIIDLAGGHQPMANEDSSLWITYNGEIFNHAQLRPKLEKAGHRYQTCCDTETILHAYEEFGPACVNQLRGMFAFAIWNAKEKRLFCARDRLGKKPFYYVWTGKLFVFASEIKALLEHPAISPALEHDVLPEYLAFGYLSQERTFFRGIRQLPPAHTLMLDLNRPDPRLDIAGYWDIPALASDAGAGEEELVRDLRRRLDESVSMRLMSDVPLGVFLSGGLDSSAIAAIAKRQAGGPVKTFSVGYAEKRYSELSQASQAARAIGTDHYETRLSREDFFEALPRLIGHEDKPIAWPSSVSLYFVSKLAAKHVKVVLTGEGSDELFGGYERYRWHLFNSRAASRYKRVPAALRCSVQRALETSSLLSANVRRKLRHTFLGRDDTIESQLLDNFYAAFSSGEHTSLLKRAGSPAYTNYLGFFNARADDSLLSRMLYADQKTYLVELLMKQDRMSMACSLESRVPFLDHTLVEFAGSIPDRLKIRGSVQKYILRRVAAGLLPPEVIHRKKLGFPTPLRQWLLHPESEAIYRSLTDRSGFLPSIMNMKPLQELIVRHRSGIEDATDRLWRLLNLQHWGDLFLAGGDRRFLNERADSASRRSLSGAGS
jgi:asparagine synthase (glutamine-hydrolysing)